MRWASTSFTRDNAWNLWRTTAQSPATRLGSIESIGNRARERSIKRSLRTRACTQTREKMCAHAHAPCGISQKPKMSATTNYSTCIRNFSIARHRDAAYLHRRFPAESQEFAIWLSQMANSCDIADQLWTYRLPSTCFTRLFRGTEKVGQRNKNRKQKLASKMVF